MDCREFRESFSDYVDAALDAEGAERVRGHLAACAVCRRFERAYRAGVAALQALPAFAPPRDFGARVVNRVHRAPARPTPVEPPALAAALAVVALVGALVVDFGRQEPTWRDATTKAATLGQAREPLPQGVGRTDFISVRVAQDDDFPYPSPYPAYQVIDSFSAVQVRFEVAAVWSGR